tara:strand:+ start:1068 stop:2339 length:1272 start_codon:yes stop_codon:yes gene_type:complete
MSDQELIEKSKKISLFLRMKARNNLKKADKEIEKPYLFYVDGYNGKHPVFIFSSFPCSKYCQGFCTPCLYSNIIHSTLNKEKIYNSLITQTDFILKNFDELITQKQTESNHKNLNKVYPNKKLATMELCGEGSFLANPEIPLEYREKILEMFKEYSEKEQLNMQIILETKVADFLENIEEFENRKEMIKKMNLTLLFGFESVDDFTRQVIYNKGLELKDFELAIKKAKELELRTSAFLFCGFHSLTQKELIEDVKKSIGYCKKNDIAIYLMLPNLQKFTLNHLLYKNNKFNFPDPRTILEIIKFLIQDSKGDKSSYYFDGYNWSIGGLTTYPEPELFLFSNGKNISCKKCSEKIKEIIYNLARNYNIEQFNQAIEELENCFCKEEYEKFISSENKDKIDIKERVKQNLYFANKQKEEYVEHEK